MPKLELVADFEPAGDQPAAIEQLVEGLEKGQRHQVLLGVTGSGKTFTIANVLERVQRPALVIAHNKTLAGQLYQEFRQFFPKNAVCFFVSYYDYYQPEAYIPQTDTYIEKDAAINDEIDRLRHQATHALVTRRDVIIVASVSCIFGLGPVENYDRMRVDIEAGSNVGRDRLLRRLVDIHYTRNDIDFHRGTFRVRGDVVDVFPAYEEQRALRIYFWGDEVESIHWLDPLRGRKLEEISSVSIFPGSHYVTGPDVRERAIASIRAELEQRLQELRAHGKLVEAQRLEQRTNYDLEMLEQVGYCHGIENYSRHLSGRLPGEPPATLIDYLPADCVIVIDESHQTLPQIKGMVRGDRSRKQTLVEHGFRLPSALDNRPLSYEEFDARVGQRIYVSATPGEFEIGLAGGVLVEQINRPTGLVDPEVEVRPAAGQVDDVVGQIARTVRDGHRVLVTTLTKRMAEELSDHLAELGIRARYLHSDIDTLERLAIVGQLRRGDFDVLVGINLLREGLDIPEVALVAVLDADREGFLRSTTALIQTAGRAARNLQGRVIFYADRMTDALAKALEEMDRRRKIQQRFNAEHGITPRGIEKALPNPLVEQVEEIDREAGADVVELLEDDAAFELRLKELEKQMHEAAERLEFELAAELRDRIRALKHWKLQVG